MPFDYGYSRYGSGDGIPTVLLVCGILGLIAGIVLLAVFLPASKRGKYFGFTKWLYDFLNFNKFWITTLLKLINVIALTVFFLGGFICLFIEPTIGLVLLVGGVVYRILLELVMVTLSIHSNVSSIDSKLSGPSPLLNVTPQPQNGTPQPQSAPLCPSCGAANLPGTRFCIKCGKQL